MVVPKTCSTLSKRESPWPPSPREPARGLACYLRCFRSELRSAATYRCAELAPKILRSRPSSGARLEDDVRDRDFRGSVVARCSFSEWRTIRPAGRRECDQPQVRGSSGLNFRHREQVGCPARGEFREGSVYLLIPFDFTSQFEFVQRLQAFPTNILPASLSPLNVQRSQFEATLANSPPPG